MSDEPIFILRAQDIYAPGTIQAWIAVARDGGVPQEKLEEARQLMEQMKKWPVKKSPD